MFPIGLLASFTALFVVDCVIHGRPVMHTLMSLIESPSAGTSGLNDTAYAVNTSSDSATTAGQAAGSSGVASVIAFETSRVGKIPYKMGGESDTTGYDCSGLQQAAWKTIGVNLPRTSVQQAFFGTPVSASYSSDWPIGLLVFPYPGHVACYIGNAQIVEAADPDLGIRIAPVTTYAGGHYWRARNVSGGGSATAAVNAATASGVVDPNDTGVGAVGGSDIG
jgi:cell wall-associated NlpC family hydrolase